MFQEERQQRIVDIVNQRRTIRVAELSHELDISEVTVRRDLDELQRKKLLIRTHGGAMSAYSVGKAITYDEAAGVNEGLKRQIAIVAYDFINDYDTVLLDSSSAALELAKCIAAGDKKHIHVISTSINAIGILGKSRYPAVQAVGGNVNYDQRTIEGTVACRHILELRVDKCFLGVNGVAEGFRLSTPRYEDADIKNAMLQVANCSFILCDHSKLGNSHLAHVHSPDYFISDKRIPGFPYDHADSKIQMVFADEYSAG